MGSNAIVLPFLQKLNIFKFGNYTYKVCNTNRCRKKSCKKNKTDSHSSNMAVLNNEIIDYQTLCHLKLHSVLHFAYLTGSNISLAVNFCFQCARFNLDASKIKSKDNRNVIQLLINVYSVFIKCKKITVNMVWIPETFRWWGGWATLF